MKLESPSKTSDSFSAYGVLSCVLSALILCFTHPGAAEDKMPMPNTRTLQDMASQWTLLKTEHEKEKKQWNEQKALLEKEYTLLKKEKTALQSEIARAKKQKTGKQSELVSFMEKSAAAQKDLDTLRTVLARAETRLAVWEKSIPDSLSGTLKKLYAPLASAQEKDASERLRNIIRLYSEWERLNAEVHLVKELLTTEDGIEKEFDVLYMGLSRAFCVSADNRAAGIGAPGMDKWTWSWDPGIAGKVRQAVQYYSHKKVAEFVDLPVQVLEVVP